MVLQEPLVHHAVTNSGVLSATMVILGVHQLSLYFLTNAFVHPKTRSALMPAFTLVMEHFKEAIGSPTKNVRVGYASFILNMAVQAFMTGKVGLESGKSEVDHSTLTANGGWLCRFSNVL